MAASPLSSSAPESSASSSSSASASPVASPEGSIHETYQAPLALGRLVLHFVAAKRSLSSSNHVYRATQLVSSSRSVIEDIVVLSAKNSCAARALDDELCILDEARDIIVEHADRTSDAFSANIASLDEADRRLKATLESLRSTIVDVSVSRHHKDEQSSIHAQSESESGLLSDSVEEKQQKTLFDFIDETTHEDLLASLYRLIDTYHHARNELDQSAVAFDLTIQQLKVSLTEDTTLPDKPSIYDKPPPRLEQLFTTLEANATDMASLLHNLVSHYDLCVTALRHTEGGGAAAKQAVQAAVAADDVSKAATTDPEESLYGKTAPEPISDRERAEMLAILENDAHEVDDVVAEVIALAEDMEAQYSQLSRRGTQARQRHTALQQVLARLHALREGALPVHVQLAQNFVTATWPEIHVALQAKTAELVDLCAFYESFHQSYRALLDEVRRREGSEARMRKTAEKAQREMDRLWDAEHDARETFKAEVGGYLPRDIWEGLDDDLRRWEVKRAGSDARRTARSHKDV